MHFYTDENADASCSYHPALPVNIGNTGPREDFAELWTFPCCGVTVKGGIVEGSDQKPDETPGCRSGRHYEEVGWHLFISYARANEGLAKIIEHELRRRGHQAWRDRSDLVPATDWIASIDQAIAWADHMVVLLTPEAVASTQVAREFDLALDKAKNVVPILLQDCSLPERIRHINCLDWRSQATDLKLYLMGDGFNSLRQAIVFGATTGFWARVEELEQQTDRRSLRLPPQQEHQTVVVKAAENTSEVLGVIRPGNRYDWAEGHLVSVEGVVYVVTEVIAGSPSTVELLVRRAKFSSSESNSTGVARKGRWRTHKNGA